LAHASAKMLMPPSAQEERRRGLGTRLGVL
jgi:hypothetical protein